LQVYIGGVSAQILYKGSAGYPGVNQINVVIPPSAPLGCWVPIAAVANNTLSNVATLPIAKTAGECSDPVYGLKGSQISPAGGTTYRSGFVGLSLNNTFDQNNNRTIQYAASADFAKYTGSTYDPANQLSPGGCIIRQPNPPIAGISGLAAGTITLSGPAGLNVALQNTLGIVGAYNANLATIPQTGGSYTWNGAGGKDVGAFSSTLNLSNPLLTWTNTSAAASVDPAHGFSVTWTGGNPGSYVQIDGASTLVDSQARTHVTVQYTCLEHVEAGQFTVPAYILQSLPIGTSAATTVSNVIYFPFTAPGLDVSNGLAVIQYTMNTSFSGGR
jgi:hypothetical protein